MCVPLTHMKINYSEISHIAKHYKTIDEMHALTRRINANAWYFTQLLLISGLIVFN